MAANTLDKAAALQALYSGRDAAPAALAAAFDEAGQAPAVAPAEPAAPDPAPPRMPLMRFLGPDKHFKVDVALRMKEAPTAVYGLLDPETDPLVSVTVENVSQDSGSKRIFLKAWIEGFSAESVRTVDVKKKEKSPPIHFLPLIYPDRLRQVTEVCRATVHVQGIAAEDNKIVTHDTYPLVLLSRNSSFNNVADPATGKPRDLSHYYGAWVTPYADAVQEIVREGAAKRDDGMLFGYQGGPDAVLAQVELLYAAVKARDLRYVSSIIDYGVGPEVRGQRTRLPRESLALKSANCIDGTVLFASLLEGTSLDAALVMVPGHALVAWATARGGGEWRFLETTAIGYKPFAEALAEGERNYRRAPAGQATLHPLRDLRARGIWPME